jgi:hypothetical protein
MTVVCRWRIYIYTITNSHDMLNLYEFLFFLWRRCTFVILISSYTTNMGSIWVDNVDPNAEVGSYQPVWVDNLDPFWLYHFPRPKNVWVDIFKTNGTTSTN